MSDALEKMRGFIRSYPDADILSQLDIDYTDAVPNCAGLFPSGLVEVRRAKDICGNVRVENQYNFALYTAFEKAPGEDAGAAYNAGWLMGFQEWVQEQSALGLAPAFGDEPETERIMAQNGAIYTAEDQGVAVYAIQISASFKRHFGKRCKR